jgi:saccharopine dehydrogenase-like NADP-dependent oxidoreductase
MVSIGEDLLYTAMAKTVGLPLGIAAKLILEQKINLTGVQIPVMEAVYEPILEELKIEGIVFNEREIVY